MVSELLFGDDYTIDSEIELNDTLYAADTGSVSVSIRDCLGQEVHSQSGETLPLVLSGAHFNIEVGHSELYQVILGFTVSGKAYKKFISIKVVFPISFGFSDDDVRAFLGVNNTETESLYLDKYEALRLVEEDLEKAIFKDKTVYKKESRLVFLKLILMNIPTLKLRLKKSVKVDDYSESRFDLNIDEVEQRVRSEYNRIKQAFGFSYDTEPLLVLGTPTDVVTGQ